MSKPFTFRCPEDLLAALGERAGAEGRDRSAVVLDALRAHLGLPAERSAAVASPAELAELRADQEQTRAVLHRLTDRLTALELRVGEGSSDGVGQRPTEPSSSDTVTPSPTEPPPAEVPDERPTKARRPRGTGSRTPRAKT